MKLKNCKNYFKKIGFTEKNIKIAEYWCQVMKMTTEKEKEYKLNLVVEFNLNNKLD
jgi:hypothetical protein